ncbi:MAG: cupin domain-containing protein [Bryobacteraceae bacterium]|nr:cupin domain-containing protein [Bryobacteraceae bacterium]
MRDNRNMPIVVDANALPWEPRTVAPTGAPMFRKNLYTDPDTGMEVRLVRYPAGTMNPTHTHPCAHGMYILEGTLSTGSNTYTAGQFVWFPEGETMQHGATADVDVTVVFITNKPFEIHYH